MSLSPQHAALSANVITTLTFDQDFSEVEVAIIANPSIVWFRADGQDPVAMTAGTQVLPAALAFSTVRPNTVGNTVVKLLSTGTPTVSVRGIAS